MPVTTAVYPGTSVNLAVAFTLNGSAADPTTVTLSVKTPAGTTTTPSPVHGVVGAWTYVQAIPTGSAAVGRWWIRWDGDGAVDAAVEDYVDVSPTQF